MNWKPVFGIYFGIVIMAMLMKEPHSIVSNASLLGILMILFRKRD